MSPSLKTTLKAWPVVFAAAALLCFLTKWVAGLFGIDLPDQVSLDWVKNARGWRFVGIFAYVVAGAPAGEEAVFRFLLFKGPLWLAAKVRSRLRGSPEPPFDLRRSTLCMAVLSSILFTASHYNRLNPFPDNAFIALFFVGLALCHVYRKTDRLWAAILCHSLFNLTNLAGLFLFGLD